ncbi:MAG: ABC transporter ATP-binding protein [Burkholderiales bacterium]
MSTALGVRETATNAAATMLATAVTPVVEVRGAVARYGTRTALAGVDLCANAGECVALLGPNGAGKTTLLRAIIGRVRLAAGTVHVLGCDPLDDPLARCAIGFVPQQIALYRHLTVRENLEVFARLAGVERSKVASRVSAALAMCRLIERAHDRVEALSGGLQRLANIAAAILHQPRLLILDEPTVGVDVEAQGAVNASLGTLRAGGMALVMTTHDLQQAEALATHAVFLARGTVVGSGRPAALVANAFGGQHELQVTLRTEPDPIEREVLTSIGLEPNRVPTVWSMIAAPDPAGAGVLAAALRGRGLQLREVRLRVPDLATLFVRLTGEAPAL